MCPIISTITLIISIHALLAESDVGVISCYLDNIDFYPRSPCGERLQLEFNSLESKHFYPRSPCGERLLGALWVLSTQIFLSTLSLRRATRTQSQSLFA